MSQCTTQSKECMEESAGLKYDKDKSKLELLPPSYWKEKRSPFSFEISNWYFYKAPFPGHFGYNPVPILEFGACKYTSHNWIKGMRWGRLVGAFHRHCNKYDNISCLWIPRNLDEPDEESHMPHGQHAECCRIFLQEYYTKYLDGILYGENDCAWK